MLVSEKPNIAAQVARQKRLVVALGIVLVLAGIVFLFALRRVAVPLRMMAGFGDIFIGIVLLVMVRQVPTPPSSPATNTGSPADQRSTR